MPLYLYNCSECENTFEKLLKMSDMEKPLSEDCPTCESTGTITQEITHAALGDPVTMGHKRPDAGFGEVLSKIKQAHPGGHWKNKKFTPLSGR